MQPCIMICFAYCQGLQTTNFCLSGSFSFIFSSNISKQRLGNVWNCDFFLMIRWIVFHPSITETVDWTLNTITYLSIYLAIILPTYLPTYLLTCRSRTLPSVVYHLCIYITSIKKHPADNMCLKASKKEKKKALPHLRVQNTQEFHKLI